MSEQGVTVSQSKCGGAGPLMAGAGPLMAGTGLFKIYPAPIQSLDSNLFVFSFKIVQN